MKADFEPGLSLRDIAKKHNVYVKNTAEKNGWERKPKQKLTPIPIEGELVESDDIMAMLYDHTMAHYLDAIKRLSKEGDVIDDPKYEKRANPLFAIVEKLKSDLMKLQSHRPQTNTKNTIFDFDKVKDIGIDI